MGVVHAEERSFGVPFDQRAVGLVQGRHGSGGDLDLGGECRQGMFRQGCGGANHDHVVTAVGRRRRHLVQQPGLSHPCRPEYQRAAGGQ